MIIAFGNTSTPTNPLSTPLSTFSTDLAANFTSVYASAHEAVSGFSSLPASLPKTFIYTGNKLNLIVIPALLSLGVGKSAAAHLIEASSVAYKENGYS